MATTFNKDPQANLDYQFNWTSWLSSDTITTASFTVPAGLTLSASSFTTTTTTAWLSGGTVGATYEVMSGITTAGGRVDNRTINIKIVQL